MLTILRNVLGQQLLGVQNLLGLDLNVRRLSLRPTERLVNHDARIGQGLALARRPRPEQKGAHGGGHAKADRLYIAGNELHGVVNGESRRDGSAGAVDVERNVLVGVFVGEVEELCDENVGDFVVDFGAEEEDAVFEETTDDIELSGLSIDSGEGRWTRRLGSRFGRIGRRVLSVMRIVRLSVDLVQ